MPGGRGASPVLACPVVVTLAVRAARVPHVSFGDRSFLRFVGLTLIESFGATIAVALPILMLLPADPA